MAATEVSGAARELMMAFASLGTNCEFGFAQRAYGAETFDLFRWAGTPLPVLIRLLNERLKEIGEARHIELASAESGELMVVHRKYGFTWHTFVPPGRMNAENLHRRECARLSRMAEILIEQLTAGDRVFVVSGSGVSRESVQPLIDAIRSYGRSPLLFVTKAKTRKQSGSVRIIGDNVLQGYIEKFADPARVPATTDSAAWLAICQSAAQKLRTMKGIQPALAVRLRELLDPTSQQRQIQASTQSNGVMITHTATQPWGEAEELSAAKQAVALEPSVAEYHAHLGALLAKSGDFEGAMAEFQTAVALKPEEKRYEAAFENARVQHARYRLIPNIDNAIISAVTIGLQDSVLAKRVLGSVFPVLRYFTPWSELRPNFSCADSELRASVLPLLELCEVDEKFYLQQYPGLRDAMESGSIKSLSWHWRNHGYFEGRVWRDTLGIHAS